MAVAGFEFAAVVRPMSPTESCALPMESHVDETVHVAVGKNARKAESLVLWAIRNNRGKKLCIVHVHLPPKINIFGAKISPKIVGENRGKRIRDQEKQKMHAMLQYYIDLCAREQVPAVKLYIESESVEQGILDLINRFKIRRIILGGGAHSKDKSGLGDFISVGDRNVLKLAPSSCKMWFIYNGFVVYRTKSDVEEDAAGGHLEEDGASQAIVIGDSDIIPLSTNNDEPIASTQSNVLPLVDLLVEELRQAKADTETLMRMKSDETTRREIAERKWKELEHVLAKKNEDLEKLHYERNVISRRLRKVLNQKGLLEQRIAQLDSSMKELQLKFLAAVELMTKYKNEVDELREECSKAEEIKKGLSMSSSSCSHPQIFTNFSPTDIEEATHNFDPSLKIGEGGYGVIYKGFLHHTPVAIKVLRSNSMQGPFEFQQEVDVLGKIRHPNVVTLIGACSKTGTLIYEYLPNGSLEDRLSCKDGSRPLSWQTRIRIVTELCSVLIFLHSNKEHCIVHGDLKPSNILLDANFVSKLSDFGICRLLRHAAESGQTRTLLNTDPKGSFAYMDPEFQWSGDLSPKSDVYSFGIILLRLLTGKPALGISKEVQSALNTNSLTSILDTSAGDWPFVPALLLARLALRCCASKQLNRPDLSSQVWTVLEPMQPFWTQRGCAEPVKPASYFLCPIFKEVMRDPHVAADGFTYEAEALKGWFSSGHITSPVTNLKLSHCNVVPNHALRSAIQEWQQRMNTPT